MIRATALAAALLTALPLAAGPIAAAQEAPAPLLTRASPHDVPTTLDRLAAAVEAGGGKVFARLDHAAAAAEHGLALRPTQVLIFGNPKGGTPMMEAHPSLAVDLPLKVAAYAGPEGTVMVWRDPATVFGPHGLDKAAGGVGGMLRKLTDRAAATD